MDKDIFGVVFHHQKSVTLSIVKEFDLGKLLPLIGFGGQQVLGDRWSFDPEQLVNHQTTVGFPHRDGDNILSLEPERTKGNQGAAVNEHLTPIKVNETITLAVAIPFDFSRPPVMLVIIGIIHHGTQHFRPYTGIQESLDQSRLVVLFRLEPNR